MDNQVQLLEEKAMKARALLNEQKYDEAQIQMNEVMQLAQQHFQDDLAFGMAEFYYLYGATLVLKISETMDKNDIFGQRIRDAENQALGEESETNGESREAVEMIEGQVIEEQKVAEQEQPQQQRQENIEELDDFKIAWENLEAARVVLEKHLKDDNSQENIDIMRRLSKVLIKLAELDQWRDRFDEAFENLQKSRELNLRFQNKECSRELAEIYFLCANILLYNSKEGKESEAQQYYITAIQILENCLSDYQNLPRKDFKLADVYDKAHLIIHQEDSDDVKELKQVVHMVYEKLEDLQIAIKEINSEEYQKVKQEMEKHNQTIEQNATFSQQPVIEERQVIQLGNFGNAKKQIECVQINPEPRQQKPQEEKLDEGEYQDQIQKKNKSE